MLIPVAARGHIHHDAALAWYNEELDAGTRLFISDHGIAELYAGLSTFTYGGRMLKPNQLQRVINAFLDEIEEVIETNAGDYRKVIDACVKGDHRGGRVYDAIHVRAAKKKRIKRIVTANNKDFSPLWDGRLVVIGGVG